MKVNFNGKEIDVNSDIVLTGLLALENVPSVGVAVAINGKVVRKAEWESTHLKENDNILVISAVCGG